MGNGLAGFINSNTKNSQMKYCWCLGYPTFKIYLQTRKNSRKNWLKIEIDLSKYANCKQPSIGTLYIYLICPKLDV